MKQYRFSTYLAISIGIQLLFYIDGSRHLHTAGERGKHLKTYSEKNPTNRTRGISGSTVIRESKNVQKSFETFDKTATYTELLSRRVRET